MQAVYSVDMHVPCMFHAGCMSLPQAREVVLEYIVERKRMDDLASSIMDGRFNEQKVEGEGGRERENWVGGRVKTGWEEGGREGEGKLGGRREGGWEGGRGKTGCRRREGGWEGEREGKLGGRREGEGKLGGREGGRERENWMGGRREGGRGKTGRREE